jgi:hypothetical protein
MTSLTSTLRVRICELNRVGAVSPLCVNLASLVSLARKGFTEQLLVSLRRINDRLSLRVETEICLIH